MLNDEVLECYLKMAIDAVSRPYPFYWPHYLSSADEADILKKPSDLFPMFHHAFDWHSCVHGYWCIARILQVRPGLPSSGRAKLLLVSDLTAEKVAGEVRTLSLPSYKSFERPYGLAWLCKLAGDLLVWRDRPHESLQDVLAPLAGLASERIIEWHKGLTYPIQTGEHNQSAFGLLLLRDYCKTLGSCSLLDAIDDEIRRLYLPASLSVLHAEPSGHDFLSPSLACALLVSHVLSANEFAAWLTSYFPTLEPVNSSEVWLMPAKGYNAGDGKLSHLIGLNFSRSWMLRMIATKLPVGDGRILKMQSSSRSHAEHAHGAVDPRHFESSHWLASFAMLELTEGDSTPT